jgi:hypothetical protein
MVEFTNTAPVWFCGRNRYQLQRCEDLDSVVALTKGGLGKFAASTSCGIVTQVSTQWLSFWDRRPASAPLKTLKRNATAAKKLNTLNAILDNRNYRKEAIIELEAPAGDILHFLTCSRCSLGQLVILQRRGEHR